MCKPNTIVKRWKIAATGLELPANSSGKTAIVCEAGAEFGALSSDFGFADAMAAVMRLPLSDTEKAQALRRLLAAWQERR